jgi:hypothetical protein
MVYKTVQPIMQRMVASVKVRLLYIKMFYSKEAATCIQSEHAVKQHERLHKRFASLRLRHARRSERPPGHMCYRLPHHRQPFAVGRDETGTIA